jgi:glycosyltransferase involved in cell wall biosynthesis
VKLAIVILALNEEKSIGGLIDRLPATLDGVDSIEVFTVDDGSTDGTREVALAHGSKVISHRRNRGLGSTFAAGIDAALRSGADVIVILDGDGQHPPEYIPQLLAPIFRGEAELVTATRFAEPELVPEMPAVKKMGNRLVARMVNLFTGTVLTDVSCGFRAYTRNAALHLNLYGRHTYTHESLLDLAHKGVGLAEVPVPVRGVREHGESRVVKNVWSYGLRTLGITLRAVRDRMPLQFFGSIGFALVLTGLALELAVLVHWATTGRTSPIQSLAVAGATLLIIGALSVLMALVADMMGRQRRTLEMLLYYEKLRYYEGAGRAGGPVEPLADAAEDRERFPTRTG